jgi:hypothetical protein
VICCFYYNRFAFINEYITDDVDAVANSGDWTAIRKAHDDLSKLLAEADTIFGIVPLDTSSIMAYTSE